MKIYFTGWHGFENHRGIHLIPERIFNSESSKSRSEFLFDIYYVKSKNFSKKIGLIKVLVNGYENSEFYFKMHGEKIKGPENYDVFDVTKLFKSPSIVTMPVNIDYYKAIASLFSEDSAEAFLRDIRDISYYKEDIRKYTKWLNFNEGFFRDGSSNRSILVRGADIATRNYKMKGNVRIVLNSIENSFEPFEFNFNKKKRFPEDINLLIGKNGLGKTHILKHVCEIFTGLKNSVSKPLLNKVVVVSFSPFESFLTKREITELINLKNKDGLSVKNEYPSAIEDYSYIGFRNFDGDFEKSWPQFFAARSIVEAIKYDNEIAWWQEGEYSKFETIFSTLALSMDFDSIELKTIKGKSIFLNLNNFKNMDFDDEDEINYQEGAAFIKDFLPVKMSSGQKIFSYIIPSIISEIQDETLLIIDEPELYLHPALEVGLVEMLKKVLLKTKSFSIIATHSAVMAREVSRNCVRILRDSEYGTRIDKPSIETYGESLDEIIGEVFDDYSLKKPYQYEIDEMVLLSTNLPDLLKSISKNIGDDALVYLMSKLNRKDQIKLEEPK